ncbi:hypothetical protein Avbf_08817 [Armadillidium vulgare]|nr:hypothetical protein Avbf_08817 [Armadillidium vulgare]
MGIDDFLSSLYGRLEEIYRYTSVSVFLCIPSVEMFRLYFSFEGNLRAKNPAIVVVLLIKAE